MHSLTWLTRVPRPYRFPPVLLCPQRWPTADIDLFIYGLDEVDAQAKLVAILTQIQRTIIKRFGVGNDVYFIKTPNTVTVGCGVIGRSIQVILRLCTLLAFELQGRCPSGKRS